MNESSLTERQRAAVAELAALIARSVQAERRIEREFQAGSLEAETSHREAVTSLERRHQRDREAADRAHREHLGRLDAEYESDRRATEREFEASVARIVDKAETNETAARKAHQESVWLAEAVFEANENQPNERYLTTRKGIDGKREALQQCEDEAARLMKRYRVGGVAAEQSPIAEGPARDAGGDGTPVPAMAELDQHLGEALARLDALRRLFLGKLFSGLWPFMLVAALAFVALAASAALHGVAGSAWIATGAMYGAPLIIGLPIVLHLAARFQAHRLARPLMSSVVLARSAADRALTQAAAERDQQKARLIEQRDKDLDAAHQRAEPVLAQIQERREHHLSRLNEKYPRLLAEKKAKHESEKYQAVAAHQAKAQRQDREHEAEVAALKQDYARRRAERVAAYESAWRDLETEWREGSGRAHQVLEEVRTVAAGLFPDWDDPSWTQWRPPVEMAPIIRFGELDVNLAALPEGLPADPRLSLPGPSRRTQPAALGFPSACSLLIETAPEGREAAVQALQTVMFRLLTSLPPGKVRFTIIDPVGLGQNFAGFMHLADFDGASVTDRIWTEDKHVEQRLSDITEHMENVIQKYLRNEYQSISEYNVQAGEIAEPFRFVVIADFPANFTETAAKRLASIVNSGARCGVFTLITADLRHPMPQGIQLSDIRANSVTLSWRNGRYVWADPAYERFPLTLDLPPGEDFVTQKLQLIGQAAKDAGRVEVPFDVIAPDEREQWSRTSESQLTVALGRAGATKLQHLTLGIGTSQHALIAGKTGSGKSTLLHAMITNLSLWYSPDEVEFYLVDFKKGVEFKTYAAHELPHARAVAIESDREFGLSVLQRLDAELKRRGNLFRDLGVQDLAGYRRSGHPDRIPRTLLIIDEFQELFTEDDKLAQDASLLLDRLVRQGRAFGMHVLLGSQTLGGAYSLARSTINQMGVRIALQCSEADSYLILSDDNAAARLLSRPGEAIYNDASGMVEGNNPFQVVWLSEAKRESCLQRVFQLAEASGFRPAEPQIVFEGNVPAELPRNHLLTGLLEGEGRRRATQAASAWLGEAIAIKDPTAAVFRRQAGANLLIVGQREESALAMLVASLLSLAAHHQPGEAAFFILDGSPPDAPAAGQLERFAAPLPHEIHHVAYRDVPDAVAKVAAELGQRVASGASEAAPIYLIIYGLQRYRQLRQEDDFSYSMSDADAAPRPDKQFADILRDGPAHGIHTLAWCDTVNNVNRSLNRQGLREFEFRVLFQMGATDSSTLIDTPVASKLGLHRALFHSEEQGTLEKFRPYAIPDERWWAAMTQRLQDRRQPQV